MSLEITTADPIFPASHECPLRVESVILTATIAPFRWINTSATSLANFACYGDRRESGSGDTLAAWGL